MHLRAHGIVPAWLDIFASIQGRPPQRLKFSSGENPARPRTFLLHGFPINDMDTILGMGEVCAMRASGFRATTVLVLLASQAWPGKFNFGFMSTKSDDVTLAIPRPPDAYIAKKNA